MKKYISMQVELYTFTTLLILLSMWLSGSAYTDTRPSTAHLRVKTSGRQNPARTVTDTDTANAPQSCKIPLPRERLRTYMRTDNSSYTLII